MTIHSEHPFADPQDDPLRRFRGRVGGTVSLWTSGRGPDRAGLTVTSYVVAMGDPPQVLALIDPESELAAAAATEGRVAVQLLEWQHRDLAETFAGLFPSPGGPFRAGAWQDTDWGPVLTDASGWLGARVSVGRPLGWSHVLEGAVEHVELRESSRALLHRRGRYLTVEG